MSRRLHLTFVFGLVLAGCESEVGNRTEDRLAMIYDISLSQNYAHDPNKSGLADVGSANGTFELLPGERKKIEVDVEVTETPNGSMVSVADSRTPHLILEILGF